MNVLITAASRRVALVKLFAKAISAHHGHVITVDYDRHSPALFFSHRHYTVPLVKDKNYIPALQDICRKEKISLLVPTIDIELDLWSSVKKLFQADGISVSVSPANTIRMCGDKWLTFQAFLENNLPFPHSFIPKLDIIPDNFPLFVKPRNGRGSVGAFPVKNLDEYLFFTKYVKNPLMQKYLEGKEFTVDAFFDQNGILISCIPRYRLVIRAGVSDRGITFENEQLIALTQRIGNSFKFEGAINIQGKINNQEISFFEINPRFSGGIQLSAAAGPSFPDLMVRELMGEPLHPQVGDYLRGVTMSCYEDSLFIDDHHQVINGPV